MKSLAWRVSDAEPLLDVDEHVDFLVYPFDVGIGSWNVSKVQPLKIT
ncbi:MAG: hypothetical protein JW839_22695 [Candidatus Lokiarchaeota archaeon]|nr:hypothetical protein [Candidatus Lokiarchaeota archaeon]